MRYDAPSLALLGLLALAACDAVDRAPPTGSSESKQAAAAAGTVASADGTPIAYNVAGSGEPTLVFIHGWSCDASYWDAQRDALARDFRVVALDLAGHGKSGAGRTAWSIPAFGEDVAAVIRALPPGQVILVGHSMGGPVALEAARLAPGRVIGVIGVDTFADLGGQTFDPAMIAQFKADLRRDTAATTRSFVGANFFHKNVDPALKKRIVDDMASAPPRVAVASMDALMAYDSKPTATALNMPITAINADLQPPMDEQAARRVAPGFRLVTIEGTGHFLQMEAPARFNAALRAEAERIARSNARGTSANPS